MIKNVYKILTGSHVFKFGTPILIITGISKNEGWGLYSEYFLLFENEKQLYAERLKFEHPERKIFPDLFNFSFIMERAIDTAKNKVRILIEKRDLQIKEKKYLERLPEFEEGKDVTLINFYIRNLHHDNLKEVASITMSEKLNKFLTKVLELPCISFEKMI